VVQTGLKPAHDCISAFSETDFRADLAAIDIPVLVAHGDDDQIVPNTMSAHLATRLLPQARLRDHPANPTASWAPIRAPFIADLLDYLKEQSP
jgi:non-heme chloroperoxidase